MNLALFDFESHTQTYVIFSNERRLICVSRLHKHYEVVEFYGVNPRPRDRLPRAELTSQMNYSEW